MPVEELNMLKKYYAVLSLCLLAACSEDASLLYEAKNNQEKIGSYQGSEFDGTYAYSGQTVIRYSDACETDENVIGNELAINLSFVNKSGNLELTNNSTIYRGPIDTDGATALYSYIENLSSDGTVTSYQASVVRGLFQKNGGNMTVKINVLAEFCSKKDGEFNCCTIELAEPVVLTRL